MNYYSHIGVNMFYKRRPSVSKWHDMIGQILTLSVHHGTIIIIPGTDKSDQSRRAVRVI